MLGTDPSMFGHQHVLLGLAGACHVFLNPVEKQRARTSAPARTSPSLPEGALT